MRADAKHGYDFAQTLRFLEATTGLGLELLEQPVPAAQVTELARLPAGLSAPLAADESLIDEAALSSSCRGAGGMRSVEHS